VTEDLLTAEVEEGEEGRSAQSRLNHLRSYARENKDCVVVCPLENVSAVMSRERITQMVSERLHLPGVKTPGFVVSRGRGNSTSQLQAVIGAKGLSYPVIGKPLVAASTRESHQLVVALDSRGLEKFPQDCLVQSYENHGGMLYKVYVIGR